MRAALFWEITQRIAAILTDVSGQPKFLALEDVADRLSRNVCKNGHYTLRNFPESADLKRYKCLLFVRCGVPLTVY
jgi:hypothetical protein